jgi:hypothetical protein
LSRLKASETLAGSTESLNFTQVHFLNCGVHFLVFPPPPPPPLGYISSTKIILHFKLVPVHKIFNDFAYFFVVAKPVLWIRNDFFSDPDPDPTFQRVSDPIPDLDPDPDPTPDPV